MITNMKKKVTLLMLSVSLMAGTAIADTRTSVKVANHKTSRTQKSSSSHRETAGGDLTLFGVKGNVKSIEYTAGIHEIFLHKYPISIKFSRTGECTNLKSFIYPIAGDWDKVKVIRNDKGRILELRMEDDYGETGSIGDFIWNGNLPVGYSINLPYNHGDVKITYNGDRISTVSVEDSYDGELYNLNFKYYDFKDDSKGNWVSCKVKITGTVDYGPDTSRMNEIKEIKRVITYY